MFEICVKCKKEYMPAYSVRDDLVMGTGLCADCHSKLYEPEEVIKNE